tara:strand:+ start:2205 stop:2444 length:240 start_codon:yes stop_codon:yes gene_type:complete
MLSKKFVRLNIVNISIFVFIIVFFTVHITKPAVIYNADGAFRPFGIGYKHKTVVPAWLVAIFLAIFSYLFILYIYLSMR